MLTRKEKGLRPQTETAAHTGFLGFPASSFKVVKKINQEHFSFTFFSSELLITITEAIVTISIQELVKDSFDFASQIVYLQ